MTYNKIIINFDTNSYTTKIQYISYTDTYTWVCQELRHQFDSRIDDTTLRKTGWIAMIIDVRGKP